MSDFSKLSKLLEAEIRAGDKRLREIDAKRAELANETARKRARLDLLCRENARTVPADDLLSRLPPELFGLVCEKLSRRDVAALLRTNRKINALARAAGMIVPDTGILPCFKGLVKFGEVTIPRKKIEFVFDNATYCLIAKLINANPRNINIGMFTFNGRPCVIVRTMFCEELNCIDLKRLWYEYGIIKTRWYNVAAYALSDQIYVVDSRSSGDYVSVTGFGHYTGVFRFTIDEDEEITDTCGLIKTADGFAIDVLVKRDDCNECGGCEIETSREIVCNMNTMTAEFDASRSIIAVGHKI